jgi:hypothetical protein
METLRQVEQYILHKDTLQGMYRVSDDTEVSYWFDSYTKNDLMELEDEDFILECQDLISNTI